MEMMPMVFFVVVEINDIYVNFIRGTLLHNLISQMCLLSLVVAVVQQADRVQRLRMRTRMRK